MLCESNAISRIFSEWARQQLGQGVRLISLEGLPSSGKSYLLQNFDDNKFGRIELDALLPKCAPSIVSWADQINRTDAKAFVLNEIDNHECLIVEGPAAWLILKPIAHQIGIGKTRRLYLKRVSKYGDLVIWGDGEGLAEHAAASTRYFQSIYEHHANDRPWESADLIIERISED